ncbi:helix-turn-helix domain-containing protein [Flavobacterium flavigenum]|uniref:helix-turn-helix domain-containing protein n=1 Tax=Flavobacterium flavigenum TaxID=3003258 RepID=UPI0022AC2D2B|nr:helix-turn-helix domain-containing protein [Flavobacterium flavigenum]
MIHFDKISDFHNILGTKPPEHPLFSIIQGVPSKCDGSTQLDFTSDFYIIGFWKLKSGSVGYGKTKYDHNCGSMSFMRPQQKVSFSNLQLDENGFVILIHQDFLLGSILHKQIQNYSYFDYDVNEALHLSPSEEVIVWNLVGSIEKEYYNNTDTYSKDIMLTQLDTMLKYAQRFYKRQFINREQLTGVTFTKFNDLLSSYFEDNKNTDFGLPTVSYMAEKLNISSRYLSDILKQETGKTALELIHLYLISEAKNLLKEGKMNIAEISISLGFENATYFSRLFKKEVGISPNAFREQSLN